MKKKSSSLCAQRDPCGDNGHKLSRCSNKKRYHGCKTYTIGRGKKTTSQYPKLMF